MKFLKRAKRVAWPTKNGPVSKAQWQHEVQREKPSLYICFEGWVRQIARARKQTWQCFICISSGTWNQPTMTSLHRRAERKSSAGIQCCLQTEQKGRIPACLAQLGGFVCVNSGLIRKESFLGCPAQEELARCCKKKEKMCFIATYQCPLWKGHSQRSDKLQLSPEEWDCAF